MAAKGPAINAGKTGLGSFPARLKNLIRDIRFLPKDSRRHRRDRRSEGSLTPEQQFTSEKPTPTTREDSTVSDIRSPVRDAPHVRSLSVRVTVSFGEPLNYSSSQDYEASSALQPTEELCEALLRRVDHCSKELITRRDSSALDRTDTDGKAKPLRYEIQAQVLRNEIGTGTEAWASRTLRSYQRQPVGTSAAREVILSTHYMVGLFLRHHDAAFVWKDGPVREDPLQEQKTFQYQLGRVQPLTSIPRSHFIEKQQDFESIPGYTIRFSMTSRNHSRTPSQWREVLEIHSHQLSPLTFASAEGLFLDASYAADGVFVRERKNFEALQKSCADHSGCTHCRPHEGDGVELTLSVNNNVGPLFENLQRTTRYSMNLFRKDHATDCIEFVERVKAALEQVRRETDGSVSRMNDFEFYISELRGQGWTMDEPLAFRLGSETCLDRRTVEALLDRLQTGVADTLRGNAIAVRMTARKRGHLILHKTLVTREPIEKSGARRNSPGKSKAYVLDRLGQRISRDIDMVCKDTCSIADRETETVKVDSVARFRPGDYDPMDAGITSSTRLSDRTMSLKGRVNHERDSSVSRRDSRRSEFSNSPDSPDSLSTRSFDPRRQWTRITRDHNSGARLLPLANTDSPAPSEHNTVGSRESAARKSNVVRDSTTEASFELTMSQGKSNTMLTQTTADSVISTREKETPNTSLAESRNHDREWYTTEGSSVSTRPGTPSLEFGGNSSSMPSSPVVSEKAPSRKEGDILRKASLSKSGVENKDGEEGMGKVDSFLRRLYVRRSMSPVQRPFSRLSFISSQTSETTPAQKKEPSSHTSSSEDISTHKLESSTPLNAENGTMTADVGKESRMDTPVPTAPMPTQDEHTEGNVKPPSRGDPEGHPASEPKPDVDLPITDNNTTDDGEMTKGPSKEIEKAESFTSNNFNKDQEATSPDPPEATDSTARPMLILPQHRLSLKSFGSANYLSSLHDQGIYSVGLRRSVLGSSTPPRPFTPISIREMEMIEKRKEAAEKKSPPPFTG
ncbi:hypothetical protein GGR50DRAFT_392329 [Xylaria sp. CBS 124048]|nr:hypothetical protein GGR50DRAFT_392329 [Xylaria sp. CBS 124048]